MRHYARKTDANQAEIVKAWRRLGKVWIDTSRQGDGCVDGFLLHRGIFLAVEIKNPKGKNQITAAQKELHDRIKTLGGIVYVIRTMDEAMALVGVEKVT